MKDAKLLWRERTIDSDLIDSIWSCSAPITVTRTALADLCVSIVFIQEASGIKVVIRGPETRPRTELLVGGYPHMAIRLRLGVSLKAFPAQTYVNKSSIIATGTTSSIVFNNRHLALPDFENAERFIDRLDVLGHLDCRVSYDTLRQAAKTLPPRRYAYMVKRVLGVPPYLLYQNQRIHEALRLIKLGISPAVVATDLNFVDQSHLTRISKQFFGHTPKQLLSLPQTS